MKILRSKGQSFTQASEEGLNRRKAKLSRGLQLKPEGLLTPEIYKQSTRLQPLQLIDYVGEDYALILRQTVSVLDKVIRKPTSLRRFEVQAYVDRTLLAVELWKLLCTRYEASIRAMQNGDLAFQHFEKTWLWKIHPYARDAFDIKNPAMDKNGLSIAKHADGTRTRNDFNGRWHAALWKETRQGKADYAATAAAIMNHLLVQELKINGEVKTEHQKGVEQRTSAGLIKARGISISKSVADPRIIATTRTAQTLERHEDIYFKQDVAALIFAEVTSQANRTDYFNASRIGSTLYDHFGPVLAGVQNDENTKKGLWELHNKVRQFYQKLVKSERFRRAYQENDITKLKEIVPATPSKLLSIVAAKEQNADVSELIRLGKLIAHASDLPFDIDDVQGAFDKRMEYLATSEGQAEIKRNENFTRVWRTSVALSLRTLKAWADPKDQMVVNGNDDIAATGVAALAARKMDDQHFLGHTPVIFGGKPMVGSPKKSRSQIFSGQSKEDRSEILWSFLRLAAELRDRTNHFNTKRKLETLVVGGILQPNTDNKSFDSRTKSKVHPNSLELFLELLQFDMKQQSQVIVDNLNRLETTRYIGKQKLSDLLLQLASSEGQTALTAPKFMSVVRRAKNLAPHKPEGMAPIFKHFGELDLSNQSMTQQGINHFKIGILRLLYDSGFQSWLSSKESDREFISKAIRDIAAQKKKRAAEYLKEKERFYAYAVSLTDDFELDNVSSLGELFNKLLSLSMSEERVAHTYRAKTSDQKERSNWLDEFKQELFALFFGIYIEKKNLEWIWTAEDNVSPEEKPAAITQGDLQQLTWTPANWESQFYAWLYLVPVDQVSLLRHQFRKTSVLEAKGNLSAAENNSIDLKKLDRLMALYISVHSAGFSGEEHENALKSGEFLYEDTKQFDRVYSSAADDHDVSLPGTRRGLRNMLRFGHIKVLEGIFNKHKVTAEEVKAFTAFDSEKTKQLFQNKNDLKELIVKLSEEKKPNIEKLKSSCSAYRDAATATTLYNFDVNGARLTEHARLHHLLMSIVGRLTDFTLMWERDCNYVYLGLLYCKFKTENQPILMTLLQEGDTTKSDAKLSVRIGLQISDQLKAEFDKKHRPFEGRDRVAAKDLAINFLPLWSNERGFALKTDTVLLNDKDAELFNRYFGTLTEENPVDVEIGKLREKDEKKRRVSQFAVGKKQIRNDFAHFNVISSRTRGDKTSQKKIVNLSYLVSSVRSLLSYDRKLKNAVSQAIADIVADEGLTIHWELEQDRLKKPMIMPKLETHLTMVPKIDEFEPRFQLPQASVRYTSMVKALFDVDPGGYRERMTIDGVVKCRGAMRYPFAFRETFKTTIPLEVLEKSFPIPPQK